MCFPSSSRYSFFSCDAAPHSPFPSLSSPFFSSVQHQHHPLSSTFGSARWWPKGAWHGGQRPSVLIRGVWHQEGSPLRCRAAPQCNNSPVCHQSRPSWLAGWRGRCGLPAVRQEEKGEGVQPEVEDALRHSEGGERKDRLRLYTNQCL